MEKQVRGRLKLLLALIPVIALSVSSSRPKGEKDDNLVRLMKADYIEQFEKDGQQYRKAIASTFLHNGTYLISDSALWNVDTRIINCVGHVKVIQDETILTADKLDYLIDEDLAQFRGTLVQLQNKKRNLLRTRNLDYNTRDSVALFSDGAAMRDEDGQLIESRSGSYNSATKKFLFQDEVNMFTDSVFMRTTALFYHSEEEKAIFPTYISFWRGDNMLTAGEGWYNRGAETFFFTERVHGLTREQEFWGDSLFYYQKPGDMLLLGNGQVQDTLREVGALADRIHYQDSIRKVTLNRNAAVVLFTEENSKRDTIYIGADQLSYQQVRYCDISDGTVKSCKERLNDILTDAVTEFRQKAAAAAAAAAAEAAANPNAPKTAGGAKGPAGKPAGPAGGKPEGPAGQQDTAGAPAPGKQEAPADKTEGALKKQVRTTEAPDSAAAPAISELKDSLALADSLGQQGLLPPADSIPGRDSTIVSGIIAPQDSLPRPDNLPEKLPQRDSVQLPAQPQDSLGAGAVAPADSVAAAPAPPDTTRYGFAQAVRNVKVFRHDIQVRCDSMVYCDLDSIARFYHDPVIWNEGNRQYTADSVLVLVGGGGVRKASLQSNAFVITEDGPNAYDQIKGAEIMAYFDSTANTLQRFDALGGASALFYLEENGVIATVNKVESKMLSGRLKDGTLDQVFYFENPHNNAYPVVQLPEADSRMKGFQWRPEERPTSPEDVTHIKLKPSERKIYRARTQPSFVQAQKYFPGYISGIRREIARRDSLSRLPRVKVDDIVPETLPELKDTVLARADSLAALADSLVSGIAAADSLAVKPDLPAPADTTAARADSLATAAVDPLSVPTVDPKQKRIEERETRRAMRIAARDARIAEREKRWAQLDSLDAAKAAAKEQKKLEKERAKKLRKYQALERQRAREEARLQKYIQQYRKKYEREQQKRRPEVPSPGSGKEAPRGNAVLRDDGPFDDDPVLGRGGIPGA